MTFSIATVVHRVSVIVRKLRLAFGLSLRFATLLLLGIDGNWDDVSCRIVFTIANNKTPMCEAEFSESVTLVEDKSTSRSKEDDHFGMKSA